MKLFVFYDFFLQVLPLLSCIFLFSLVLLPPFFRKKSVRQDSAKRFFISFFCFLGRYFYFTIAKYPKTTMPKTMRYQPKTLKSCFLI